MISRGLFVYFSFSLFVLSFYAPGVVLSGFFKSSYEAQYNYTASYFLPFTVNYLFFLLFFGVLLWFLLKLPGIRLFYISSFLVRFFFSGIIYVYFFCSLDFFINYDPSFRHTSRLVEAGVTVKLLFFLKPILNIYFMFALVYIIGGGEISQKCRRMMLLYVFSSVLFLNSALQMIGILIVLIMAVKPEFFVFSIRQSSIKKKIFLLVFLALSVVLTVFIGIGNKIGFSSLATPAGFGYLVDSIGSIVARTSSSLVSNATLFNCCRESNDLSLMTLESMYQTFFNRVSLLFPFDYGFDKSIISTVSRTNYLLIYKDYIARAGASPGVLASIYYFPLYPLGYFFIPFFYAMLAVNVIVKMNYSVRYNVLTMLAMPFFIVSFFEAPLNVLYVIDPVFVSIVVFFLFRFINIGRIYS